MLVPKFKINSKTLFILGFCEALSLRHFPAFLIKYVSSKEFLVHHFTKKKKKNYYYRINIPPFDFYHFLSTSHKSQIHNVTNEIHAAYNADTFVSVAFIQHLLCLRIHFCSYTDII